MGRLDNRLKRLEAATPENLSTQTYEQLNRRLAELLAKVCGESVEWVEAALPIWKSDGTLDAFLKKLEREFDSQPQDL
ncbi:MAG: hypothetical protein LAT81_13910 [Oceanicaulis sp.]|nr:hypothetical protein [Oceanicaulis sp.]